MKVLSIITALILFFAGALMALDMKMPSIDKDKLMQKAEQKKEIVVNGANTAEKAGAIVEEKGQVVEQKAAELDKTGKAGKAAPKVSNLGKSMQTKGKIVKVNSGKVSAAAAAVPAAK